MHFEDPKYFDHKKFIFVAKFAISWKSGYFIITMKIIVIIKQVPDTETKIKISATGDSIDAAAVKWIVNPYDEIAIEEAVKIKESKAGSTVWAISVGPKKRIVEALRTALAMGADEAIAIDAPENWDSFQVAQALATQIKTEGGAEVISAGKLAIDDQSASVPQMLAQILQIPHVGVVSKLTFSDTGARAERDIEGGAKEIVELPLPFLFSANKGLNQPRYASLPGIMKAKKKTIKEVDGATLGVSTSTTKTWALSLPADKAPAQMIAGEAAAQAVELVKLLRETAKVI
jgi:electron transfer flavoprotein beta subunit